MKRKARHVKEVQGHVYEARCITNQVTFLCLLLQMTKQEPLNLQRYNAEMFGAGSFGDQDGHENRMNSPLV